MLSGCSDTIMSDSLSEQIELLPDESVSQFNFDDDIQKDNEDLYDDGESEASSARILSGRASSCASSESVYFIVTEATLGEGQVFVKVL